MRLESDFKNGMDLRKKRFTKVHALFIFLYDRRDIMLRKVEKRNNKWENNPNDANFQIPSKKSSILQKKGKNILKMTNNKNSMTPQKNVPISFEQASNIKPILQYLGNTILESKVDEFDSVAVVYEVIKNNSNGDTAACRIFVI